MMVPSGRLGSGDYRRPTPRGAFWRQVVISNNPQSSRSKKKRSGAPNLTNAIDKLFARFLKDPVNWYAVMKDKSAVDLGLARGIPRLTDVLVQENSLTQEKHLKGKSPFTQSSPSSTGKASPRPRTTKAPKTAKASGPTAAKVKPNKEKNKTPTILSPRAKSALTPTPVTLPLLNAVPVGSNHTNGDEQNPENHPTQQGINQATSSKRPSSVPVLPRLTSGSGIPFTASSDTNLSKRLSKNIQIIRRLPRFFFPNGQPVSHITIHQNLSNATEKFKEEGNCITYAKFGELLQTCGLPFYWKKPVWMALYLTSDGICKSNVFIPFFRYLLTECADEAARFVWIMSSASKHFNNNDTGTKYNMNEGHYCPVLHLVELTMSDFVPLLQDIIDSHPDLEFLRNSPDFHYSYITVVISRIFYTVNRSWSGKLTLAEIRRSNLLQEIRRLETEPSTNTLKEYFSYQHFYVIYCKFWEIDKDHDCFLSKHDLARHADHALSLKIIDRIFSGTVLRGWSCTPWSPGKAPRDKMTFSDFVWFLLSEEDKTTPTAIEYWFRCLDVDGDGVISPYELQFFYSEQEKRIESLGITPMRFPNVYCQIIDMLPCSSIGIHLHDLKKNPTMAASVFNAVFNLDKYLEQEQTDPFAAMRDQGDHHKRESEWEKYVLQEYELLLTEETCVS